LANGSAHCTRARHDEQRARGKPGFVSDDYLNSISAETTLTAIELVGAGLWERSTDGYLITDPEMRSKW
jgi:hypothetical protein